MNVMITRCDGSLFLWCTGTFGRVYLGVLIGEDENEISSQKEVYIKTTTG